MDDLAALQAVEGFAGRAWDAVAALPRPERRPVSWSRDGLAALFARIEELKDEAAAVQSLAEAAAMHRGLCLSRLARWRAAEEDKVAEGLNRRSAELVTRGMSFEERKIAHLTASIDEAQWRRRFERAALEVEALEDALRSRSFLVRDERADIHSQVRLLSAGVELAGL